MSAILSKVFVATVDQLARPTFGGWSKHLLASSLSAEANLKSNSARTPLSSLLLYPSSYRIGAAIESTAAKGELRQLWGKAPNVNRCVRGRLMNSTRFPCAA